MEKISEDKVKNWLSDNHRNSGSGYGYGSGSGYGYGDGYGDGSGYGSGYGSGSGSGSGYGIKYFNGLGVYLIDSVQTIITHIKKSVAKGFILNDDLTMTPCFVVKGQGYFAHGKTLQEATESLREKIFENLEPEQAIEEFMNKFEKGKKYKGTQFFEWHHYLTGSCLMGRESFVKNHGFNLDDEFSVDEFIEACENDYGSDIIKQLKERWNE